MCVVASKAVSGGRGCAGWVPDGLPRPTAGVTGPSRREDGSAGEQTPTREQKKEGAKLSRRAYLADFLAILVRLAVARVGHGRDAPTLRREAGRPPAAADAAPKPAWPARDRDARRSADDGDDGTADGPHNPRGTRRDAGGEGGISRWAGEASASGARRGYPRYREK